MFVGVLSLCTHLDIQVLSRLKVHHVYVKVIVCRLCTHIHTHNVQQPMHRNVLVQRALLPLFVSAVYMCFLGSSNMCMFVCVLMRVSVCVCVCVSHIPGAVVYVVQTLLPLQAG